MDLSKIKLVVTDMDGTLLNSNNKVSPLFFELYKKLKEQQIIFIAASGRQYQSITDKLEIIKNEITIIAENGGVVKQNGEELFSTKIPFENIEKTIHLLRNIKDTHVVLCGKNTAYIETEDLEFISIFSKYYVNYKIVKDLTKVVDDDFLKIAIYHIKCSETFILPAVKHLEKEMQVTISGEHWLDISHLNANKGYALNLIQKKLGISKKETLVFGDYNNDLKMLALAKYSFAMQNAHPNVKKAANYQTKSNDEQGVEFILKQVIDAKKA